MSNFFGPGQCANKSRRPYIYSRRHDLQHDANIFLDSRIKPHNQHDLTTKRRARYTIHLEQLERCRRD